MSVLQELFVPCCCVKGRRLLEQLREEIRGYHHTDVHLAHDAGARVDPAQVAVRCPHCNGAEVVPSAEGRKLLNLLAHYLPEHHTE